MKRGAVRSLARLPAPTRSSSPPWENATGVRSTERVQNADA